MIEFAGRPIREWEKMFHDWDNSEFLGEMVVRGGIVYGDDDVGLSLMNEADIGIYPLYIPEVKGAQRLEDLIQRKATVNDQGYLVIDGIHISAIGTQLLIPYWKRIEQLERQVERLEWYITLTEAGCR